MRGEHFYANMINFPGIFAPLVVSELEEICALHALVCLGIPCADLHFSVFTRFGHWPHVVVFILNKTSRAFKFVRLRQMFQIKNSIYILLEDECVVVFFTPFGYAVCR